MEKNKKHVVISLSGGMDSSTLLLRCLKEYDTCTAISFDYGQKHRVELERAQSLVDYINETKIKVTGNLDQIQNDLLKFHGITPEGFSDMIKEVKGEASPITYRQIKLDGLTDLLNSALVTGGDEVPEGHYAEENMKATVVPNRNKIFASIVQAVALSIADQTGENCDIALGIHAGDHAIYPDCRQEFRDADDAAFRIGNWGSEKVGYFTPYLEGDKFTILQDGEKLCEELGLDFDEVYSRTNTSYKPIFFPEYQTRYGDEILYTSPTGFWFSDYKSASSVERVEAFIKLGRKDPVGYADPELGPVSWEFVVEKVTKVLKEYTK
jgi:7-cyano-7-deazaguanine synthase